jgi:hypothetical protein
MKNVVFRRGAHNWVADFEFDGRERVAYYDRDHGKWYFAHIERYDPATLAELNAELTGQLKDWLKQTGQMPTKGE